MRYLLLNCALALVCAVGQSVAADNSEGFTFNELRKAVTSSRLTTQRINSIQTFGDDEAHPAYMAVLSSSRSGWHVFVFHILAGKFQLEWYSNNLPDQFTVSSANALSLEDAGDEQVVLFSGCAPHLCGGDRHGFLVYSTVKKEAFFALLEDGHLSFSKNAMEPHNERYEQVLQKAADAVVPIRR